MSGIIKSLEEEEGFKVVGVDSLLSELIAGPGILGVHFANNVRRMKEGGFQISEVLAFPDLNELIDCNMKIMMKEMAVVHKSWFEDYGISYGPRTADLIDKGRHISDEELDDLLGTKEGNSKRIEDLMDQNGVDLELHHELHHDNLM